MTAGQPEGVGQQQGPVVCLECGWHIGGECSCYEPIPAPSPTPPARDSGRDEDLSRRIIAMLKDLPASVSRHGQVAHVRWFLDDEMARAVTESSSGRDEAREAVARWRTGRKLGRTLYEQVGPEPSDVDPLIGVMDTAELAQAAVDGHNALMSR